MPINSAIKVLAVVLESFHMALLITADGLVSLPLDSLGGTLGVILSFGNKEAFCSVRRGLWGGISAPLCAKAEKKKVGPSERDSVRRKKSE